MISSSIILRLAVAVVLLAHSVPTILDGSVNDFGKLYLDNQGFAPFGLVLAWAIKLSHVLCAILLTLNKWIKPAAFATMFVLVAGIVMVHWTDGWFVVGSGRNGIEFNFLLICVLLSIAYQDKIAEKTRVRD